MVSGLVIGLIELSFYFFISYKLRKNYDQLQTINIVSYYWLMMTILTFIWEFAFIIQYDSVYKVSNNFLDTNQNVWTSSYELSYVLPWELSKIFYAEYAAYADKEYMLLTDDWSRVIEGTHALLCGIFSLIAIVLKIKNYHNNYLITVAISMGSQLMNSILYMANYFNEVNNPYSVNYNSKEFPSGIMLYKRPFMYVNIFWTIMPLYTIIKLLIKDKRQRYKVL